MKKETIKRNKVAFDWWLENDKSIWVKGETWYLTSEPDWEADYYVADNKVAEYMKAYIDGKRVQFKYFNEWVDIDINCSRNKVIANGIFEDMVYRIKSERWKPEKGGVYHFININGEVGSDFWFDCELDKQRYRIGNCFRTTKDCENAIEAVTETLNKFHEEE